ncbi:hypothetical protein Bbelb_051290 [Branchiostoma belcheri]|nr:hypothetical protein Bbelb_051290 [Branchiostoma belcheri]
MFYLKNGLFHLPLAMEHVFHCGLPEVTLHEEVLETLLRFYGREEDEVEENATSPLPVDKDAAHQEWKPTEDEAGKQPNNVTPGHPSIRHIVMNGPQRKDFDFNREFQTWAGGSGKRDLHAELEKTKAALIREQLSVRKNKDRVERLKAEKRHLTVEATFSESVELRVVRCGTPFVGFIDWNDDLDSD